VLITILTALVELTVVIHEWHREGSRIIMKCAALAPIFVLFKDEVELQNSLFKLTREAATAV
jgi:hypothetical protein